MARSRAIASLAVSVIAKTGKFISGLAKARRALFGYSKAGRKATFATRALNQAFSRVGGVIGGFAAVSAFSRLLRSVETFNQAMNESLAIMGNVGEVMRDKLQKTAIEVASTVKFSAAETAKAYFFLASAGLSAQQSIAALPLVAKFAQAGMFDLSRATDLLTDAQSALGLTVDDATQNLLSMTRVADVLVKANTLANASVEQFSEALTTKAAAALRFLGKEIEEGVAVLAVFADQGKKGADAGTALDIVIRELSEKAIKNTQAFRKHRIAVFDATGTMRNFADIVENLTSVLEPLSPELRQATLMQLGFSAKSVSNIKTLIGLADRIREYEKGLRLAGGTTAAVSAKQLTPMQKALAGLTRVWGENLDAITNMIGGLAILITTLGEAFDLMKRIDTFTARTKGIFLFGALGVAIEAAREGLPGGRTSKLTGKRVFISEEEEKAIERIARLFREITEAQTKARDKLTGKNARTQERRGQMNVLGGANQGAFREVNLSRFAISALSGLRGKSQTVKDPVARALLKEIRNSLRKPSFAVAG